MTLSLPAAPTGIGSGVAVGVASCARAIPLPAAKSAAPAPVAVARRKSRRLNLRVITIYLLNSLLNQKLEHDANLGRQMPPFTICRADCAYKSPPSGSHVLIHYLPKQRK